VFGLREISARVGAIVRGQYGADLRAAAAELAISEIELRALLELSVPPISREALATILSAVVRHFGVDPAWLVTGRYDVWSHAAAEERSTDPDAIREQIERLWSAVPSDRPVEIERVGDADRHAAPAGGKGEPVQRTSVRRSRSRSPGVSDRGPDDADDEPRP
jgi:DNA-binding Lrp family transcriptional regulator